MRLTSGILDYRARLFVCPSTAVTLLIRDPQRRGVRIFSVAHPVRTLTGSYHQIEALTVHRAGEGNAIISGKSLNAEAHTVLVLRGRVTGATLSYGTVPERFGSCEVHGLIRGDRIERMRRPASRSAFARLAARQEQKSKSNCDRFQSKSHISASEPDD